MPNTVPTSRVPQPQSRAAGAVRSTSLRALAVAAHLEGSRITTSGHGPDPAQSGSSDLADRSLINRSLVATGLDGAADAL